MKVRIAVKGRFHAFDLARELARADALGGLLTTYPRSATRPFGLGSGLVQTRPGQELLRRTLAALPAWTRNERSIVAAYQRFDRTTCAWLRPDADVFVGWSGASLASLTRARQLGLATVLERGSTHAAWARERLAQVFDDAGVPPRVAPLALVERELEEYASADRIAIPSSFVEQTFLERGVPAHKLVRNAYGVDLERFHVPPGPAPDGAFRVLFVGAVGVRKGILTLLDAFARLPAAGTELVLVGRVLPELAARLRRLPGNVRLTGSLPQAQLVEHYRRASVFCLPSFEEGLAMVIPQAMAASRAIVASHASGAGDLVTEGEHGHLIAAGDVDALATRLHALFEEPERAVEYGRRAAQRVAAGFSWSDYGARALQSYRALLDEREADR